MRPVTPESVITPELIHAIRGQYNLYWHGTHGVGHWARVLENGLKVAEQSGANHTIVMLFAVFHDAQRINDGFDPLHGKRGGELARAFREKYFKLPDVDLEILNDACRFHTDGKTHENVTIQTCWDADRLDLGRVGIVPNPKSLCTAAAKNQKMIDWAMERSLCNHQPEFMKAW